MDANLADEMVCPKKLFRVTSMERAKQLVAEGIFTYSSARAMNEPHLTPAQRDDEQTRTYKPRADLLEVSITRKNSAATPIRLDGADVKLEFHMTNHAREPLDYYISCWSKSFDPGRYASFNASACICCFDFMELVRRIRTSAEQQMPDMVALGGAAEYYDSQSLPKQEFEWWTLMFQKDFQRFASQDEYRFVLLPLNGMYSTPIKQLRLGPLSDICSVHEVHEKLS